MSRNAMRVFGGSLRIRNFTVGVDGCAKLDGWDAACARDANPHTLAVHICVDEPAKSQLAHFVAGAVWYCIPIKAFVFKTGHRDMLKR